MKILYSAHENPSMKSWIQANKISTKQRERKIQLSTHITYFSVLRVYVSLFYSRSKVHIQYPVWICCRYFPFHRSLSSKSHSPIPTNLWVCCTMPCWMISLEICSHPGYKADRRKYDEIWLCFSYWMSIPVQSEPNTTTTTVSYLARFKAYRNLCPTENLSFFALLVATCTKRIRWANILTKAIHYPIIDVYRIAPYHLW